MPFAGYKDFNACVQANKNKGDPKAYCGHIMHQVEGKTLRWTEIPLLHTIYKDANGTPHLAAYISSTRRDRDGDAFHEKVLHNWANTINAGKINLGMDHSESWKDTLGVWKNAEVRFNPTDSIHYLYAEARLENPSINKDVELLLHKADIGEQISLSIAANPPTAKSSSWYERSLDEEGNAVRTILQADLLKADLVGEPSNPDARFLGVVLKHNKEEGCDDACPVCFFNKRKESHIIKMEHGKHIEEEEEEKKKKEEKLSPEAELEKFIQQLKDSRKANVTIDLPTLVTGVLGTISKAPAAGESGTLPDAKIMASPGNSGTGPSGNAPQGVPAPSDSSATKNVESEPTKIMATPGISGSGGGSNTTQPVPAPANLSAVSNVEGEPTKINAGTTPGIKKTRSVFATRERLEELRKASQPKNESPGELLPLAGDNKEINVAISKIIAEQVKKQYSVEDLAKMAESGQLLKELDPNGLFVDAVKSMGRKPSNQPSIKKVKSIFLQKQGV